MDTSDNNDIFGARREVVKIIPQKDGSEVKLTGQLWLDPLRPPAVNIFALHRETPDQAWTYLSEQPHPDWRKMSVDEYIKHGRSPLLQKVSPGQILQVSAEARALA